VVWGSKREYYQTFTTNQLQYVEQLYNNFERPVQGRFCLGCFSTRVSPRVSKGTGLLSRYGISNIIAWGWAQRLETRSGNTMRGSFIQTSIQITKASFALISLLVGRNRWKEPLGPKKIILNHHVWLNNLVHHGDPISFVGGPWRATADLVHGRAVTMLYRSPPCTM